MNKSDVKAERILSAVRNILSRQGFTSVTISQVAAEAGVSRGLLHYYFKNKEEMLTRVVQDNIDVVVTRMEAIFSQINTADTLAEELMKALRDTLTYQPDYFVLFVEGWFLTRRTRATQPILTEGHRRFRLAIKKGLQDLADRKIINPAISISGLAAIMTGIVDGYGMQMVIEPELIASDDIWKAAETAIRNLIVIQ